MNKPSGEFILGILCCILWVLIIAYTTNVFGYDGTYIKYGVGVDNPNLGAKLMSFGYQAPLLLLMDYQLEGGVYNDTNQSQGPIGFGNADFGFSAMGDNVYAKAFFGPAFVTSTDSRLSSIFEFNHDFELGIIDHRGVSVGMAFKHMSNAGIWGSNLGRDFGLFKVQIPF